MSIKDQRDYLAALERCKRKIIENEQNLRESNNLRIRNLMFFQLLIFWPKTSSNLYARKYLLKVPALRKRKNSINKYLTDELESKAELLKNDEEHKKCSSNILHYMYACHQRNAIQREVEQKRESFTGSKSPLKLHV